jgi:hypothetical protein
LEERSRAPKKVSNRTSEEVERLIVGEKRQHMTWGPKKIQSESKGLSDSLCLRSVFCCCFGSVS